VLKVVKGRLGEMGRKRKRDDESVADTSITDVSTQVDDDEEDDEFEGFSDRGGAELEDVVGDVDEAFGLDSDDEESDVDVNDEEDDASDPEGNPSDQLREELQDHLDVSKQDSRRPSKKKRQKT